VKPALFRFSLAALAASSLLVACGDDTKPNPKLTCEFGTSVGALPLGTLCLDSEISGDFTVTNMGSAPCELTVEVGGAAPQFFAISQNQLSIPVGGNATLTATFKPTIEGGAETGQHYLGKVLIHDSEGDQTEEVSIDGQTAATETKAILSVTCADSVKSCSAPDWEQGEPCCRTVDLAGPTTSDHPYHGRKYLGEVKFGQVQTGRTASLPLEVTNLGCGTLEVSDLQFQAGAGTTCGEGALTVVTPFPVSIPGSVSTQERNTATIELQFGSAEPCVLGGVSVIVSNDPDIKDDDPITRMYSKFPLDAQAVEGHLTSFPGTGDFGDVGTGETKELKFQVENKGGRAVDVESVGIRNGSGQFAVTKAERVDCTTQEATEVPFNAGFTLEATDYKSGCGADHVNLTVAFSPDNAGRFEDWLEVDYGFGALSVKLAGSSRPDLEVFPGATVYFFGPSTLQCEPQACTVQDDMPNGTCDHVCLTDADCTSGVPCVGGVCAANGAGACVETCSYAERTIRLCNKGHAPLKFDDSTGGGAGSLVITDSKDPTLEGPKHQPDEDLPDPTRDNQPMFSVVSNNCADSSGNGLTLPRATKDESGQVVSMECCDATIRYLDTRNGGSLAGVNSAALHVYTNDPGYPPETYGFQVALMARSDYDADPIAAFDAYDFVNGPGSPPKMGKMVVLDASKSRDPLCKPDVVDCQEFGPVSTYEWVLVDAGGGDYATAMEGPIDLENPNKNCPNWINDGNCYEVVDLGAQKGKVIRFYADNWDPRSYKFRLRVTDGVCDPPHRGETENTITINAN
jgi:hypothetical protein